jgi:hypothetical protein
MIPMIIFLSYDAKRDVFNYSNSNVPYLDSQTPTAPVYGVYILQLA